MGGRRQIKPPETEAERAARLKRISDQLEEAYPFLADKRVEKPVKH